MESAYATIEIGGTLRRADIDQLVAAMDEDYCLTSYANAGDTESLRQEIFDAESEKRPISLIGEDVPYAEFDSLEALCRRLGLSYKRGSDPIFDAGKTITFWKPGMEEPADFDAADGEPVLSARQIRKFLDIGTIWSELIALEEVDRFRLPLELEGSGEEEPTPAEAPATEATT